MAFEPFYASYAFSRGHGGAFVMARGFLESKTLEFKTYCFGAYKSKYGMNGRECLALFKKYKVFSYLDGFYDALHTTSME